MSVGTHVLFVSVLLAYSLVPIIVTLDHLACPLVSCIQLDYVRDNVIYWLPSADLWQGGRNQQLHSLPCSHYAVGKEAVDLAFDHRCKLAD